MKARDVMTTAVHSVRPETPVKEIARLMLEQHISGVPVLDGTGRLVGVVSQSDLIHRHEIGTEPRRKWWLRLFDDADVSAREYTKTHGLKARDVMTRQVVSVNASAELADVASVLDTNKVKRVPVLRAGMLEGLITRSDLVKALINAAQPPNSANVDDSTLQRRLSEKMKAQSWLNTGYLNVLVEDGTVRLWGFARSHAQRDALRVLVEETDGVKAVEDHLQVRQVAVAGI